MVLRRPRPATGGRRGGRFHLHFHDPTHSRLAQTQALARAHNVSTHHGKQVRAWLAKHPRFILHFTPVHCSWINQVEQWFGILQRKRLRIADFQDKADLAAKLRQFIEEWNERAHPFNWSTKSVAKVMADAPQAMAA